jgi:type I restriction enzyme R subunit
MKRIPVIVDEAHSSQSGEAARKLKEVLTMGNLEDAAKQDIEITAIETDTEDEIRKSMLSRGQHKNSSFFAFTATPKAKTLEVFGVKDAITGKPVPFHLYSMRQAIEEGFILDVLKNYTTYKTFFKLSKQIEDDPKINKKKATRAIARFVSLHPHNLAQKTEVIVEHFRQVTIKKIGGKAKAMVVTASRPHVIRYKQEFDKYIKEKGYEKIRTLVAFSAFKDEFGILHKESDINSFGEKELPDKFNTMEYQLLLVADKYQTGFDQPLLHTMYVDKKLSGVKAVQTLSRLNRIYPGKEDTFILDFVNDTQEILDSFQPYYEQTTLKETTNPNQLYDLKLKLEATQIFWQSEIDAFCNVFFKKTNSVKGSAQLNAYIDPAVDRYKAIEKEEVKEDFKHTLTVYLRLYSFLSQIMPFQDAELEKFYVYGRLLLNKLPKKGISEKLKLNDEVAVEYYKLKIISEGSIILEKGKDGELNPATEVGTKKEKEELAALSEIINVFNERFGKPLTDADKLFFDQIEEELVSVETLSKQARTNTIGNFKYGFQDVFINKLIERMEQNKEIFAKIMDDNVVAEVVMDYMLKKVYKRLNEVSP